jgi:hypothetical protein
MVHGHAEEQTENQKVRSIMGGEAEEVDKDARRHKTGPRRAETAGRQTGSKRPIEGRSMSGG